MKTCKRCGIEHPVTKEYFYPHPQMKDGFLNFCIPCHKEKGKAYQERNPERKREYNKKRYKENVNGTRSKHMERYYANHEEIIKKRKVYRDANRGKINAAKRESHKRNPALKAKQDATYRKSAHGIARRKKYMAANREKYREIHRVYNIERRKSDPQYKLLTNLRTNINRAIKAEFKKGRAVELIGCSIEALRAHIESQFTNGMSWENYGGWHLDHRVPCAAFDLSKPEEQKLCFHHTNLQPLWAIDNLRKWANVA